MMQATRRQLLAAGTVGMLLPPWSRSTASSLPDVTALPLDYFDPFAPPDAYIEKRFLYYHGPSTARVFARLWSAYEKTGEPKYGEWALIYLLPWWRAEGRRSERIKITNIADRAAARYIGNHTLAPGGPVWQAVMRSARVATLGLLEAAHMLPEILGILERAEKEDRPYYRGIIGLARAKIYYKAPAFPASVGDMPRAQAMIEDFRLQADTLGVWWVIAAEVEYINGNREKAMEMLTGIESRVKPPDMLLAYSLDTAVFDAYKFLEAIRAGTYSRYMWDPFFIQTKPGLNRSWRPV